MIRTSQRPEWTAGHPHANHGALKRSRYPRYTPRRCQVDLCSSAEQIGRRSDRGSSCHFPIAAHGKTPKTSDPARLAGRTTSSTGHEAKEKASSRWQHHGRLSVFAQTKVSESNHSRQQKRLLIVITRKTPTKTSRLPTLQRNGHVT